MFVCDRCGLCCKNIGIIPELREYDNGKGTCVYLTENNLCSIYSCRPDICNIDKMFKLKYHELMSREEYDDMNTEGCILLKNKRTRNS